MGRVRGHARIDRRSGIGYTEGATLSSNMDALAHDQYCYLTTTGRKSGKPHTIEMWFATPGDGQVLYMLAGGGERADWVRNMVQNPSVEVRIGGSTLAGTGRVVTDAAEERIARRLVVSKYYGRDEVRSSGWEATSLPVAVDLTSAGVESRYQGV